MFNFLFLMNFMKINNKIIDDFFNNFLVSFYVIHKFLLIFLISTDNKSYLKIKNKLSHIISY